jgi:hypothetical protein
MGLLIKITLTTCFALFLSSCGFKGYDVNYKSTVEKITEKVTVSYDEYKKTTHVKGPKMSTAHAVSKWDQTPFSNWFIRARKHKSDLETYQIYVDGASHDYYSATDINGKNYEFTYIGKRYIDFSQYAPLEKMQTFGIDLSRGDMNLGLKKGINIKVYSKSGKTQVIIIPSNYIKSILDTIDAI